MFRPFLNLTTNRQDRKIVTAQSLLDGNRRSFNTVAALFNKTFHKEKKAPSVGIGPGTVDDADVGQSR